MREYFRLSWFAYVAVVLLSLLFWRSPAQIPIVLYKFGLVTGAAVLGYWLDRHLFVGARKTGYTSDLWMLRRAIIVGACVVAIGIAL